MSTLNFNVGVLGHIDSGKTSLAKALSTIASTACFDKNPQSKERGITIDLGFSSFSLPVPTHMADSKYEQLQFTLVDCPGHASLIRTIIGGAQIIDLMMLVVDVTKGVQTQTAECLVIGEICCDKLMIVLNKIDLLPADKQAVHIDKMTKRLQKTLEKTKFSNATIVSVSAKPGGPDTPDCEAIGINELIEALKSMAFVPHRDAAGDFIFSVDHCFSIRGQGTVMTGTVVSGSLKVNENLEIVSLKETRKVKSIQMFRKPVERIMQGDRAGICVTQFDPKLLERGMVSSPGVLPTIYAAIISISKISYFKGPVLTKAKFHISLGHETVMGKVQVFGDPAGQPGFDLSREYMYLEELGAGEVTGQQFALLEFERCVNAPAGCLVIGSKLDTDIHLNTCRLAFQGQLLYSIMDRNYRETELQALRVYKYKHKEGLVERVNNSYEVIGKSLFKKESNIQSFVGLRVVLSTGEKGVIEGSFGQSGKYKVRIPDGLQESTLAMVAGTGKKSKTKPTDGNSGQTSQPEPIKISLQFKRFVYDPNKKMVQN